MASPIVPIRFPQPISGFPSPAGAPAASGFESVFKEAVEKVGEFARSSQESVERFLSGEGEELHRMVLSTQRAELAFELFLQVRNKVVQAYQEVMRMQL